jgi:hypothetical protein
MKASVYAGFKALETIEWNDWGRPVPCKFRVIMTVEWE